MAKMFRSLAVRLPDSYTREIRRFRYRWQIARDQFRIPEPEYDAVSTWLAPSDCVIDVGANVGHYTIRFARIVGPSGRVFSFEPISSTFALLAANVEQAGLQNVTLVNAAASDATGLVPMDIPDWPDGSSKNFYRAHLSETGSGARVLCLPVDSLSIPTRVALVKIDAEGFDVHVLNGMQQLLKRDRPRLIVEMGPKSVPTFIRELGYDITTLPGSPNVVLVPPPLV